MAIALSSSFLPGLISPLAIAPMIDWTYTHFRVFMRMLAPNALLYTEMQTTGAMIHNPMRALNFQTMEFPLALQLGGADTPELVKCALLAEKHGFSEVNLNLGCPSDRVQAGRFGACLMAEPKHVGNCIRAMKQAVNIPITAKTRIGIDHQDSYDFFSDFAYQLIEAGCDKLIVHARKAWLKGLSPKQNRMIPPLNYEYVYKIKQTLPTIPVVINGNIMQLDEVMQHLQQTDGIMLGRLALQNPYVIAKIHHALYPHIPLETRSTIIGKYIHYVKQQHRQGVPLGLLLKPIFNVAHGLPSARMWKHHVFVSQQANDSGRLNLALEWLERIEGGYVGGLE